MAIGEARPGPAGAGSRPKRLEETMRGRLGRECVYVPSCRFGLFVALRHWCPPGGRVLMSPVNDDVIFFVVLAAGLRPVQAPLNPLDASIDIDAVPEEVWGSLSAVLTTNLYGNPDPAPRLRERCDALGIPLFEDGAHAIGSETGGRPVGAWGDASVFSLSKHVHAQAGGILAFADPGRSAALRSACADLLAPRRTTAELAYLVRPYAEAAVRRLGLRRAAWATLRLLGMAEREDIRMPLRPRELAAAAGSAPDLDAYDPWVRVDMHDYRLAPGALRLRRIERRLGRLDEVLDAAREGTRLLLSTRWALPRGDGTVQPLFRVPLFVADRDAAAAALARHGIVVGYLYDPPLDDYAGKEFTDPSPAPEAARWFARHALPVDPLRAREAIEALERSGVPPAAPPEHLVREPGPPPDEKTQKRNEAIQSSGNDRHAEDKESTTPRELGPSRG
ncbi:DegT/DnrJ/EryC1/StrS aminotransferase family protein [Streptomyces sp. SBST2-5]|uniref:DegT/DnrJ/EryC1/StrS aminotransferase family protein n=1 Tax=Streptomyces composti TaxID=2720025 RepID=A0ABX1A1V9_9ACTN|nr:DegT/DnrJ/EryC1/StrS family aminotransferase [Streptomyces composti]NJP49185.1 DegT/DnrJ/EryC1/StrS aminotransferase family protein [Streptomyces composti]